MHIDFALPAGGDLAAGFARYQAAAAKSVMDYSFHMAVTSWDDKACSPTSRSCMTVGTLAALRQATFTLAGEAVSKRLLETELIGQKR